MLITLLRFKYYERGLRMADLSGLINGMKTAMAWIFTLFNTFIETITSNDLLLYPVLLFIVIGAVGLVISIVRRFGMKSRRS